MNTSSKVTAEHLRRLAYLYVRQSTLRQVHENCESTARQYDLKRRAQALGWMSEQIVVIDEDLGLSGATAADRNGFQRLVAEVGLGHVGVVMGLEVSRLARSSTDWHRLLEICALADTLILLRRWECTSPLPNALRLKGCCKPFALMIEASCCLSQSFVRCLKPN